MRNYDTSRLPRGEAALRELIDTAAGRDDSEVERHFLEVKSEVDPTTKDGLAKIAKFILGAANRMPDVAATAFEGHAIMLVGVGEDGVCGVPRFEVSDLTEGLLPYLSAAPPRWHFFRIDVEGKDVLVIIVEPPAWGDPPYHCHRDGVGLANGATYVRADGLTRPATGPEMTQLFQRAQRRSSRAAATDLDVSLIGTAHSFTIPNQVLEDYISAVRRGLGEPEARKSMEPKPPPPPSPDMTPEQRTRAAILGAAFKSTSGLNPILGALGQSARRRDAEQFLAELDAWEAATRAAWPKVIEAVASSQRGMASRVVNHGATFLENVELTLEIRGPVEALEWWEDPPVEDAIPDLPKKWGERGSVYGDLLPLLRPRLVSPRLPLPAPTVTYENTTEGVRVIAAIGVLRPEGGTFTSDDDDFVLVLRSPDVETLRCTWSVTASEHHERLRGEFDLPTGETLDLEEAARGALFAD